MSKFKHTPGPWRLEPYALLSKISAGVGKDSEVIFHCYGQNHRINARLITAAPEMFELLEFLGENYYECLSNPLFADRLSAVLGRVRVKEEEGK